MSDGTEAKAGGAAERGYQPVNIYCASCGAPAKFDVARQLYTCRYCGAETGIRESLQEKQGFRALHRSRLEREKQSWPLVSCACTGCGATVVFPENDALSNCAFCGRSLARKEYLSAEGFPELLIPFRVTEEEARARLLAWCDKNPGRREAKDLRKRAGELRGFYLPYELIKGPTDCTVRRNGAGRAYHCRGFLEGSFVNTSRQLNNLLLDGMEPYDLSELREFDFSYLAGQRVKIRDLDDKQTASRVTEEIAADYTPAVSKTMESRAVTVTPSSDGLLQLAAVLPAYYLRAGNTVAAVNGQTGKVAVRESKDRFLLPWQLKPILWTVVLSAVVWAFTYLFGTEPGGQALITGCMAVFLLITLFTAFHNHHAGEQRWRLLRRIFTSDDSRPEIPPPQFYEAIDGRAQAVELRFTTPLRLLKMLCIALGVVFLPLILAFVFNGFSAQGLTLGGAAVWLCITVPVAPVYFLNFGRLELYEHPLIWLLTPEGGRRRYRPRGKSLRELLKSARSLLSPGVFIVLAVVIGILIINVVLVLRWDQF